jgi:hypothetical protein
MESLSHWKKMPATEPSAVDRSRLLAMDKINMDDRAVKTLVRHQCIYQVHKLRIFSAG